MKKIPVGATIAHAYRFAFSQFVNILKLMWLPLVVSLAGMAFLGRQLMAVTRALLTHDFSGVTFSWPLFALLYAVSFVMSFMQMTAIYQFALERPEAQNRRYYFSLAAPIWRTIGAFLLLILVMLVLMILFVLAIVTILFIFRLDLGAAHVSDTAIKGILALDVLLAFLVGYCGFIFCSLRFGFLLFVTTIVDNHIALFRAWTLSHGNFWRMFAILLAIFMPFLILEIGIMYANDLFPHLPPPGATAAQIRTMQIEQALSEAVAISRMQYYWYITYPIFGLVMALLYGILAGAQSFAYRALTETPDSTPNPL